MSSGCSVVMTTTNSEETAILIARTLIECKLAACVQIDEVRSFFYYEAVSKDEREFRLVIKAPSDNYESIEESIKLNHNYELPQIIRLDIAAGSKVYIDWVLGN